MQKTELRIGDVVLLDLENCRNPMFKGCLLTVTEPKEWGVQGYVQDLGKNNAPGGQASIERSGMRWSLLGMPNG